VRNTTTNTAEQAGARGYIWIEDLAQGMAYCHDRGQFLCLGLRFAAGLRLSLKNVKKCNSSYSEMRRAGGLLLGGHCLSWI